MTSPTHCLHCRRPLCDCDCTLYPETAGTQYGKPVEALTFCKMCQRPIHDCDCTVYVLACCSVLGCDRPRKTRNLCSAHYQRWRSRGTVSLKGTIQGCLVRSCDGHHHAKGLCLQHYQRQHTRGTTDPYRPPEGCSELGCDGHHHAKGMCVSHYRKRAIRLRPKIYVGREV